MSEIINGVQFSGNILCPNWRSQTYSEGFGRELIPDHCLDFDHWLDRDRKVVQALVRTWGAIAINPAAIREKLPRWVRLHGPCARFSAPWHADGGMGFEVIVLAQGVKDRPRNMPTLVAPAKATFRLLQQVFQAQAATIRPDIRAKLQPLLAAEQEPCANTFAALHYQFNEPCRITRHTLRRIIDEAKRLGADLVYEHRWSPGSVLLIDTKYTLRGTRNFSRVVHARMIPEDETAQGDLPWHSAI
ncbi:MAG: hypothetical protein HY817_02465 [Candidatus Abawacabacteria bacterium]|nr:hypothetical protein [Candidatus Abawacabacteria bacterium]